jgi:hypothetical protein
MRAIASEQLGVEPRERLTLEAMPFVYYTVELVLREVAQVLEEHDL